MSPVDAPGRTGANLLARLLDPTNPSALHFLRDDDPTQERRVLRVPELASRVRGAAAELRRRGVKAGDAVAICAGTEPGFVAWLLGAMWIGAIPVPLPSMGQVRRGPYAVERLRGVLEDAEPVTVLADLATGPWLDRVRWRGRGTSVIRADEPPAAAEGPAAAPDEPMTVAFVQYTSGSTGTPKGVVVTRGNLRANVDAIGRGVRVGPGDRVLVWVPLHHDMGLVVVFLALYHGIDLYLFSPRGFLGRPVSWLRAIAAHRATLTTAPHFAYGLCAHKVAEADLAGLDLSSLRLALDGAEPVRAGDVQLFIDRYRAHGFDPGAYHPVYGLAEATLAVTFPEPGEGAFVDRVGRRGVAAGEAVPAVRDDPDAVEFVSVGRPLSGHAVEIRDPATGDRLQERRVGAVWIDGPSVSPRYFRARAREGERAGPLLTGDLGYLAEGRLYLVDRLKDLIVRAGAKYAPADFESCVESIDGVRRGRVIAFGVPRVELGTEGVVVAAEVRPNRPRAAIADEARRAVQRTFGIALDDVVLLAPGSLPLTINGKLMRHRARAAYQAGRLGAGRSFAGWLRSLLGRGGRTRG